MKANKRIHFHLILIVFLLSFPFLNAADWETLDGKVNSYYQQGKYEIAIEYSVKAIHQAENEFGKESIYYASSENFLAMLYQQLEQYIKAEPLYRESSRKFKKLLGEGHPFYGTSAFNLGNLYHKMSRYDDSEKYLLLARDVFLQNHTDMQADYASVTYNLAKLYFDMKKYNKSKKYFIEVLLINRELYGQGDMNYITPLFELASLYRVIREYQDAKPLYKEILEIYKLKYGEGTPNFAHALTNLAIINDLLGSHSEAIIMLNDALSIYKEQYGEKHQYYIKTIKNLARVYDNIDDYDKAKKYWIQTLNEYLSQIKNFFPSLAEEDKGKFYNNISSNFEEFNSFVLKWSKKDPELVAIMYNNQLSTKALLLNASSKVRRRILNSGDKQLINKFKAWIKLKEQLGKFYSLSKKRLEKSRIDIGMYERKAKALEKQISKESELFANEYSKHDVTWDKIRDQLKPDEAAIEIVRFRHFDKHWTDSVYYAVMIITTETKSNPQLVVMTNGVQLETDYLNCYKNMIRHKLIDNDTYFAFWKKINEKLSNTIKKIFISLDGVYNQISLVTVQLQDGTYLIDNYDINVVNNTKFIVESKEFASDNNDNASELYGDPNFLFDRQKEQLAKLKSSTGTKDMFVLKLSDGKPWDNFKIAKASQDLQDMKIAQLPGTEQEVNEISKLFEKNKWKYHKNMKNDAKESSIKSVKNPKILHIATHGYFLQDIETVPEAKVFGVDSERAIENPLLRSGLLFAGATIEIARVNDESIDENDNGILTAYEAMNLDLDKTELVVLSACETGLGEIKNGEGVYGLQRAFEVAGAKTIIMSLWTVDDNATREFMTSFYKNWLESGIKKKAFRKAQLYMKDKYAWPYLWGAFVLVGE